MEKKKNSEHGNPAIMVAAVLFVATGVAVYRYITNLKKEIYIASAVSDSDYRKLKI